MKTEHAIVPGAEAFAAADGESTNGVALADKQQALETQLAGLGRLMIAYSGGADSAYLAYAAYRVLGDRMLAVIADSPSLPRTHLREAIRFAEMQGIPLRVLETHEMENPDYVRNDSMRCFHCKDELFNVLTAFGEPQGFAHIAYGMNVDDLGEYRPGQQAARQHSVLAPLAEAGLRKSDIRQLAKDAGLDIWDKPASACLSSRVAYGMPVTRETLTSIEQGEEILYAMGFRQFRVRHHGEIVRLEIARAEMERMLSLAVFDKAAAVLRGLGYKYVTLDLEGYRSGSMNDLLPVSQIFNTSGNTSAGARAAVVVSEEAGK